MKMHICQDLFLTATLWTENANFITFHFHRQFKIRLRYENNSI